MGKPKKLKNKAAAAAPTSRPTSTPSKNIKKKAKGKKNIGQAARESASDVPAAAAPTVNKHKEEAGRGQNGREPGERSSGFVFFCNEQTKPECFRYRVFGFPQSRLDVVERIKPGARLFLFDFDVKLVYGIYRATSKGGLNLVPEAFKGKFPAQVKFKIEKDCLPLPDNVFKQAIEENYESKIRFKPDLNSRQVQKLMSLFRPISLPTLMAPQVAPQVEDRHPPPPAYLPPAEDPYRSGYPPRVPPTAIDPRYGSHLSHPPANDPYVPAAHHYLHGPPAPESRQVPQAILPHNDPYYLAPRSDPYRQAGVRAYYPEKRGQHERYEVPSAGRLDGLYHPERGVMHAELPPRQGYLAAGGYDDPNRGYNESIQRASQIWSYMQPDVPVSSRYSFAGAVPAYR